MDANEIQARLNGAATTLWLNPSGGSVYAGGTYLGSSDIRLKKDVKDLNYGLEEILKLRSVSFNWKNAENIHESIGFIAQEIEPVIQELVFTNEEDGMKSVNYDGVVPVLVNAIKEQQVQIENQQKQIDLLIKELEKLKK